MLHSYGYMPLFVPFFDIPVRLGNLFQRIASIYDRFYLPRFNQLFEGNCSACHPFDQLRTGLNEVKNLRPQE
jgi:hypothetical protein